MSGLTDLQLRDAAILASQGDTPEAIARHLLVEVDDLPASIRRKAKKDPAATPDHGHGTSANDAGQD